MKKKAKLRIKIDNNRTQFKNNKKICNKILYFKIHF